MTQGWFGGIGIVRLVAMWIAALSLALPSPAAQGTGPTVAPGSARSASVAVTLTDTVQQVTTSYGPEMVLRGILRPAPTGTLGVMVKGVPGLFPGLDGIAGLVEGNQFVVQLPLGRTAVNATLVVQDFSGVLTTMSIPVPAAAEASPPNESFRVKHPAGLAPLTAGFEYSSLGRATHVRLDADGDGTADADETTLETFEFTYRRPGLYLPRLTVTDANGQVTTVMAVVHVADREAMDARILPVWRGVKDALRAGDIPAACRFVHSETRAQYEEVWKQLPAAKLADIDQIMTQIKLVEVGPAGAQYEMQRDKNGQTLSFPVWFQLDQDGLWRLQRF